ncbi:MAG: hypothetical protein JSW11_19150 [Candidatus Heimdallarchaeota archaeon]|nr:MAG: hypothetical protein JSW11_19150 [Candidatus Heimdallarchaeota archaeon]
MNHQDYSIRDFIDGDEESQAFIFNQVMKDIEPGISLLSAENIKTIQARVPIFSHGHIKFLICPNGKISGYGECRGYVDTNYLDYPLILKEHRSDETLNMLFEAIYAFSKSKYPGVAIATHSYLERYTQVHDFFQNQNIAKINRIQIAVQYTIPVESLNFETPDYDLKPFTKDDIEKLIEFRYSNNNNIIGDGISAKSLSRGFSSGRYSPEKTFFVYQNENLIGWTSVSIHTPINEAQSRRAIKHPIAVPGGYIRRLDHEDRLGLEKAMFKASYKYLKKKNITEYRVFVISTSPFIELCDEIGLKPTGEREISYIFT